MFLFNIKHANKNKYIFKDPATKMQSEPVTLNQTEINNLIRGSECYLAHDTIDRSFH